MSMYKAVLMSTTLSLADVDSCQCITALWKPANFFEIIEILYNCKAPNHRPKLFYTLLKCYTVNATVMMFQGKSIHF